MTLQAVGHGIYFPPLVRIADSNTSFNSSVIDATGEKFAMLGVVQKAGNVRRVGFRFGTVTKAGGSGLTVSLQDISTTVGQPSVPDETQDETVAIANGDTSFASNTWIRTGTLSADRTVAVGDRLAVVVEFDGGGRLGSDAVNIATQTTLGNSSTHLPGARLKTASWAAAGTQPIVVLEYDDGTFAGFDGLEPFSAFVTSSWNSGSTPDEYALKFQMPWKCKVGGFWVHMAVAGTSSDFDIVLYDGTTAIATASFDSHQTQASTGVREMFARFSEQTLNVGTNYYLSLKPTTANSVSLKQFDVSDANHLAAWPGGTLCHSATRTDAGSWSDVTTRRPAMGVLVTALDDAAGGGGGLMRHPGMRGGLSG